MSISATTAEAARRVVEELPAGVRVGPPQSHAGLSVFPLSSSKPVQPLCYLTLDHAIAAGTFRVAEVSEGGRVPDLKVVNDGDTHVLLLDGEELIGAKQNRVLNVTVLAPARKSIVVPVSCVEHGRWARTGDLEFKPAEHVMYASLRRDSSGAVRASVKAGGGYRSDQRAVWRDIAEKSARMGSTSDTGAMRDMYLARKDEVNRFVDAITAGDDQVGAAFFIGDRLAGLELFDHPSTLRALLPKLVRSYAMDAIEVNVGKPEVPPAGGVEAFIRDIGRANKEARAGVGLGEDVRLSAPRLVGGALVFGDRVVHLSAFPLESAGETARTDEPATGAPQPPGPRPGWLSSLTRRKKYRQ